MQADQAPEKAALEDLQRFIGEWTMEAVFPLASPSGAVGRTVWEWLPGARFVVQRWEVAHPDAPDGIAIIGAGPKPGTYAQHYFDSRGVARLYEMTLTDGAWRLWRDSPDFSPLAFSQRFLGTFGDDDRVIRGRWESSADGSHWEHDFDLTYTRVK